MNSLFPVFHNAVAGVTRFEVNLSRSGSEFIVFRFSQWQLSEKSRLVISAEDSTSSSWASHTLDGKQHPSDVLFSPPLYSSHVILEYFDGESISVQSSSDCQGFQIDQYRDRSLSEESVASQSAKKQLRCPKSLRGSSPRTTTESVTSLASDPETYQKTLPVVRILVQKAYGAVSCTGFFVGCAGHVLTNSHCVSNQEEATHVTFELSDPTSNSSDRSYTMITGALLIASSPVDDLDYALLLPRLSSDRRREILELFGFLTLRSDGARLDERIYIPQFPGNSGSNTETSTHLDKQVALKVQKRGDQGDSFGQVTSVDTESCNSRNDSIGYSLATSGGSSGAPVIAYTDHTVVGLHYCAGNRYICLLTYSLIANRSCWVQQDATRVQYRQEKSPKT